MRGTFFRNLTANALQLLLNQGLGLLAFYLLAVNLPKEDFGQLNWTLAILLTSFGVVSLGIDQLTVRKISAGEDSSLSVSLLLFHTVVTGLLFYIVLLLAFIFIPAKSGYECLLLLGAGKLFFYFSSPFKQLAAGRERFRELLYMSVISSFIKAITIVFLVFRGDISLQTAIMVYVLADLSEWLVSLAIAKTRLSLSIRFKNIRKRYLSLLMEAWPQAGSVIFGTLLTRIDWILIGILLSTARLAEYSFAYRIFELALLPLMMLGPVLLPWFTRNISEGMNSAGKRPVMFLKTEVILSTLIALLFCILWTPVMDPLTQGRYGKINQSVVCILAASMPFLYVNNFLWTVLFSQKKLKPVLTTVIITLAINIVADLILLPLFGNAGAAAGYLLATVSQCGLFLYYNKPIAKKITGSIAVIPPAAAIIFYVGSVLHLNQWIMPAVCLPLFLLTLYFFGYMRIRQLRFLNYVITR